MNDVLFITLILLLIMNMVQFYQRKKRNKHLIYLTNKIKKILAEDSKEQLLLVTDDKEMRMLLNEINQLLAEQHHKMAMFEKTRNSTKNMLANISHDLRTPLTVVLGYIETLQNHPEMNFEEKERRLERVRKKTMEIIKLMNDFFNLAKLESGDQEIPLIKIDITEVCKETLLSFYDLIGTKGLKVELQFPEQPIYVLGNMEAFHRVLYNLLSNAIQYGSDGKVLGLSLQADNQEVWIDVWDRGKGIAKSRQDLVFERMYTLEESRNKAFQGSGLGLTITKNLVERMNGTIHVTSRPYEKTTFTVRLKRLT